MSGLGNTPFICKSMRDGVMCGRPASMVYATATTTRLICDGCAAEHRSAKGLLVDPPIVDVALLELMPAREALRMEKDRLARLSGKRLAAMQAEVHSVAGWRLVWSAWSLLLVIGFGLHLFHVISRANAGILLAAYGIAVLAGDPVRRARLEREMAAIDKVNGFPEREGPYA